MMMTSGSAAPADDAVRERGIASSTDDDVQSRLAVKVITVDSDEESAPPQLHATPQSTGENELPVVRLAASKIALLIGLHEFGDVSEIILEYVYQNREELLEQDAKALNLRVVSKDDELAELLEKAGATLAPQLAEVLKWTRDRERPVTQAVAAELLQSVDGLVTQAQARGKRKLKTEEAQEVKRQLSERIRLSYGCRNEDLALQTYEKQTGSAVRMSNEEFYFLRFPSLETSTDGGATDFTTVEQSIERRVVARGRSRRQRQMEAENEKEEEEGQEEDECDVSVTGEQGGGRSSKGRECYFTICGMIDGVADTLEIAEEDDEWRLVPILLEVKNRMRAFRIPPPLYDYIQMAIYLKMVGLTAGDLVQCLHADRAHIHVTRVAMSEYPLCCKTTVATKQAAPEPGLWVSVILPRLYTIVETIDKIRRNDLLRLAFLNGSKVERLAILRRECDFQWNPTGFQWM